MSQESQTNAKGSAVSSIDAKPAPAVLVIEPGGQSFIASFVEAWHYRELFLFLVWRDIAIKYKQTVMGVTWVVLQPLVTMVVFTLVFNRLAHIPSDNTPYPIFVLAAIIPWNLFAGSLNRASDSLVRNSNLLTKIYFPRVIIPGASALAEMVDLIVSLSVLSVVMLYYRYPPGVEVFALPLLVMLTFLCGLSFSMLFSAMMVRYRDVRFVVTYLVQIWMYATPVVYPYSLVPDRFKTAALLNPMVGIVEGFRWCLLGGPFPGQPLAVSCLVIAMVFVIAQAYFRRMERTFADVV